MSRIDRVWGELWALPHACSGLESSGLDQPPWRQYREPWGSACVWIWSVRRGFGAPHRQPCMIQLQPQPRRLLRLPLQPHAPRATLSRDLPRDTTTTTASIQRLNHVILLTSTATGPVSYSSHDTVENDVTSPPPPTHLNSRLRRLYPSHSPTLPLPHPGAFLTVETTHAVPSRLCLPP